MIYSYFSELKAVLNASPLVEGYKVKKSTQKARYYLLKKFDWRRY